MTRENARRLLTAMVAAVLVTAACSQVDVTLTLETVPAAVRRIDGEPLDGLAIAKPGGGIYFETCESTPSDYEYWVVWERPAGGEWNSDNQDITSLELAPDDTVALVNTYRGEPAAPSF